MKRFVNIPIAEDVTHGLSVGDSALVKGVIVTARDAAHRWLHDRFITHIITPTTEDQAVYEQLQPLLDGGVIYHCGPVVKALTDGRYQIVSAGPTTSMREEPYQADIIRHFNLKGVIGKGGMGVKTRQALEDNNAVYFHAIGGAAAVLADCVDEVLGVLNLDFGIPEAMWILQVTNFPVIVTMDAHGNSLHQIIQGTSSNALRALSG